MLDLNFDVTHSDSMEHDDFPAYSVTQMEDSGTSNSSIVNEEEATAPGNNGKEEVFTNNASGFIFDIIRKQKESDYANWVEDENASPELVTQPLFPVAGKGRDWDSELHLGLSTLAKPQWLNLSLSDPGGSQTEVKIVQQKHQLVRKSRRGPRSRSSQYRGVTFYRRTGRWESHIWDCGKQIYLGGFDTAHAAARAYDRAALKFRGIDADINFNTSDYEEDIEQTKNLSKEEFVYILRRHGSGFSRGSSSFPASAIRKSGQWEARVEQILEKKVCDKNSSEINLENGDNLDLSLGILQEKFNAERREMDGSDSSLVDGRQPQTQSVAMASHHPSIFGTFQGFPPSHLDRVAGKRNGGVGFSSPSSPQRFTNGAWQRNVSGKVFPVPVFAVAASSGFSSFTTIGSPPANPLQL